MWPKMERCNARSMEIYRRLGLVGKHPRRRPAGLGADGRLHRHVAGRAAAAAPALPVGRRCEEGDRGPQRRHAAARALSAHLAIHARAAAEVGGRDAAERHGALRLRIPGFTQDAHSVTAEVSERRQHVERSPRKYLVGCDGGTSNVRQQLGIKLAGEGNILQLRQALYRCDDLFERIAIGKGRHYHVADAQSTQLIVQDSTRHFTLHSVVEKDEDMAAMFERTVAMPVQYEMLYVGEWRQNLLVADRFGQGRVLLAGDAVHLMIPTGGLGMNTGVGDAVDLGWKLAGTLQGWGGPGLLASYETERRPIGERNVGGLALRLARPAQVARAVEARHPRRHAGGRRRARTSRGGRRRRAAQDQRDDRRRARLSLSRLAADLRRAGDGRPTISSTTRRPPGRAHGCRTSGSPTAASRCRTASATATRCCGSAARRRILSALARALSPRSARRSRCSMCPDAAARDVYQRDLLLVRPDLHVVWRGNAMPEQSEATRRRRHGTRLSVIPGASE